MDAEAKHGFQAATARGRGPARLAGKQRTRRELAACLPWRPAVVTRFVGSGVGKGQGSLLVGLGTMGMERAHQGINT